jgi:uncharacterized small protein (DUF1192 family)
MDEELSKKPASFVLGGDLDRHSLAELEALAQALERELARVRQVIASRDDVRARAEALFKAVASPRPEDD